jgi:hemoglobin/transferrin/lactoferrin receptor protein
MPVVLATTIVMCASTETAGAQTVLDLDTITVLATKTDEKAIDSLAGVSIVTSKEEQEMLARRFADVFAGIPGVWAQTNADDPGTSLSIRGLQDFGRVAVIVDGARQNFQVSEHGGQGKFYFDPEMFSQVEVSRGPVSNIYGSGAIGGVVSITTKEVEDILVDGDVLGASVKGFAGSNGEELLGSAFVGVRPNENIEALFGAVHRESDDYTDGHGDTVVNTGEDTTSELAKLTIRPADGHEVKLSVINYDSSFDTGEPDGDPEGEGVEYGNDVASTTATGKYSYEAPDNSWIDFESSVYWSHTRQDSVVKDRYVINIDGPPTFPPDFDTCYAYCADFTGPVGTESYYDLTTIGFDVNNSSLFDAFGLQHTLTVGGDFFDDDVNTGGDEFGLADYDEEGYKSTPSGERQVGGAFAQLMTEYGDWLDVIGALRYDAFHMEGGGNESDGGRLSPKITVGVTPFDGFTIYGLYAEGYRAPAVTEAFVNGYHPGAFFKYIPNPGLKPEIGKTFEAGINYQRDGLLTEGDALRVKANVFLNNVDDFIDFQDLSASPDCDYSDCYGYINVAKARIKGVEIEGTYDTGAWFVGASGTVLDGEDVDTGERLYSVLPAQVMITAGARFFDEKLTVAPNWRYVTGVNDEDPETDYDDYNLFGMTVAYQPNERTTASLVVDNIFDTYYTPYLQNVPGSGITVKGALEVKLGYN